MTPVLAKRDLLGRGKFYCSVQHSRSQLRSDPNWGTDLTEVIGRAGHYQVSTGTHAHVADLNGALALGLH